MRLAIKEWAGVIEALNNGSQILMIRKYEPDQSCFLLYPTYTYYTADKIHPDRFKKKFRKEFVDLARDAAQKQLVEPNIVRLEYLFELDEIVPLENKARVLAAARHTIWTDEHVWSYAEHAKKGVVAWIGRTKRLPKPVLSARQTTGGSITTYKHFEDVDVSEASLVIPKETYAAHKAKVQFSISQAVKKG